ncbi:MAG: isoprenyl transferase [Candidatus Omnitrophota bacterium]
MPDKNNSPKHVAIIMDGNGRWAKKKRLPKIMGHREGVESIRDVLGACEDLGIKYLTLYTFSTENWKRPKKEVDALMGLLEAQLDSETEKLNRNNVRVNAIGRLRGLPPRVQEKLQRSMELTKKNTGVVFTLALNYGGRTEIIDAVKNILDKAAPGKPSREDIDEKLIARHLYTRDMPDPDLLIRTSGEMRISNFLLWQISYAEIYVTEKFWPDFRKQDLRAAVAEYQSRQRRYGA